jgi:hypothetical protein
MVNTNILTLFYFGILYSKCYFQTYKVCLIITTIIRGKIQQKMHYKIYICTIITSVVIWKQIQLISYWVKKEYMKQNYIVVSMFFSIKTIF